MSQMAGNVFPFGLKNETPEQKFWGLVRLYLDELSRKPDQDQDRLLDLSGDVPDIDKKSIPKWVLEKVKEEEFEWPEHWTNVEIEIYKNLIR